MKLKQRPADFRVQELTDVKPGGRGDFALYRLEKSGWTTPDAILLIRRRWQLDARRVSYGGLKDRHAQTVQYLSIYHGPRRGLEQQGIKVHYLGQCPEPFTSRAISGNRFDLTLRSFTETDAARVVAEVVAVERDGVVNYFDDQRFGSVGDDVAFVARHMVQGDYEAALRQALAAPYEFDRAEQRREKEVLRECWGRWVECKERLPRGHARSLVDYLVHHSTDFRGAVARLRPELQGMYLSAYQSFLWNRIVADWLSSTLGPRQLLPIRTRLGELAMVRDLTAEQAETLRSAEVTLPAARSPLTDDAPWAASAKRILAAEGLAWADLKLRGLRKPFFTRGERAVLVRPAGLHAELAPDDVNPGRVAVTLAFTLPRGSYATMVVKRLIQDGADTDSAVRANS